MTVAQIQLIKEIKSNGDLLASLTSQNPIISRLKERVLKIPEKTITSYDRMHHRHNRS